MSGKMTGLVWDMDLPQNEKYVLLAYADHADHEGYGIHPSYDLIAWKTGYTRQGVIQIVKRLAAKKILIKDRKGGPDSLQKRNLANEWHIDVEAAPMTPPRIKRLPPGQQPLTTPGQQPLTTPGQQPLTPTSYDPSVNGKDTSAKAEEGDQPEDKTNNIADPLYSAIATHLQEFADPKDRTKLTYTLAQLAAGVWRRKLNLRRLTAEQYQKIANSIEPFVKAYRQSCPDCALPISWPGASFESWYTKLLPLMERQAKENGGATRIVFIGDTGYRFPATDRRSDKDITDDYQEWQRHNPNQTAQQWYDSIERQPS